MLRALTVLLGACVLPACLGESLSLTPSTDAGTDANADASDASPDVPAEGGCGDAGKDCLGGECIDGKCEPVVIAPPAEVLVVPTGIEVDQDPNGFVYYTTLGERGVRRARKDGSSVELLTKFPANTIALTVDDVHIFVASFSSGGPTPLHRTLLNGSSKLQLADKALSFGPYALTNDQDYVYWVNRWDAEKVIRAPKQGGPRQVLYQTEFSNPLDQECYSVAVDESDVFFGCWGGGGKLGKRAKDGSGAMTVLAAQDAVRIALHDSYVYFSSANVLFRVPKDGSGAVEKIADFGLNGIDDGFVYWAEYGTPPVANGVLRRMKLDGSNVEILAEGLEGPSNVAFDAQAIYWTNQSGHTVMKLAK